MRIHPDPHHCKFASPCFRWALVQTVLLLAMGAWQMRHLKSFFEAKKLV